MMTSEEAIAALKRVADRIERTGRQFEDQGQRDFGTPFVDLAHEMRFYIDIINKRD